MAMKSKLTMVAAVVALSVSAAPGTSMATTYSTAILYTAPNPCWEGYHGGVQNTCTDTEAIYFLPTTDTLGYYELTANVYVQNPSASSLVQCEIAGTYCSNATPSYTGYLSASGSGDQEIPFSGVNMPCAAYIVCQVPPNGRVWGYSIE
jgi:hypothetical protein